MVLELDFLASLSSNRSAVIYLKIISFLKVVMASDECPETVIDDAREKYDYYVKKLEDEEIPEKFVTKNCNDELIQKKDHTLERKFHLENYLALSEHSLYCKCQMAREDDLRIENNSVLTIPEEILCHKVFLERLIKEFCQARRLLYH